MDDDDDLDNAAYVFDDGGIPQRNTVMHYMLLALKFYGYPVGYADLEMICPSITVDNRRGLMNELVASGYAAMATQAGDTFARYRITKAGVERVYQLGGKELH